ncbi:hypothetical protein [Chloroherpeton thalassium]|nr:hypothetical protein [Chloroherpeton thalassium]
MMTRKLVEKEKRIVQGKTYPYFYNPMWGHFGESLPTPSGTHYHARSEQVVFFWNMYDQVLIRPALFPYFDSKDLLILTSDGKNSLLTSTGTPDIQNGSDHLPILFKLNIE